MKHLLFTRDYWDMLLSGLKNCTIRYGKITEYKEGDEIYIHCGGYVLGKAKITRIEYKTVGELTEEDALLDGFPSKKKLKEALKKHYPKLKSSDYVTIICFKWIEIFENPILSEDFAWRGFNKDPVYLAKLALEKYGDKLTEKQKEYLRILIEEGSIRKAAIRLGGLHKRPIFRKLLRRILEEELKSSEGNS